MSLIFEKESYAIRGAAMEVYRQLGNGFLETVYQEAPEIEFQKRNIPYQREKQMDVVYSGVVLKKAYKMDFLCYDKIVVELKAVSEIHPVHITQTLNYMKGIDSNLGMIVNFGKDVLDIKRLPHEQSW